MPWGAKDSDYPMTKTKQSFQPLSPMSMLIGDKRSFYCVCPRYKSFHVGPTLTEREGEVKPNSLIFS